MAINLEGAAFMAAMNMGTQAMSSIYGDVEVYYDYVDATDCGSCGKPVEMSKQVVDDLEITCGQCECGAAHFRMPTIEMK